MRLTLSVLHTLLLAPLAVLCAADAVKTAKPAWGDQGDGTYRNPILWADYNNPCVFKAGDTFYLTCASHHFMGIASTRDSVAFMRTSRPQVRPVPPDRRMAR
ncbi:MAG: hypothetical protein EBS64_04285 [Verrucomicrobia bacterium]|nr:hypothetical protein [Verrucomicrobiota bacterium]